MPNRAKYTYNDPVIDNYKEKKLDKNFVNQVAYLIDALKQQSQEMQDIITVRSNPDMHTDRYFQKKGNPNVNNEYYDSRKDIIKAISANDKLTLNAFNKLIEANWGIYNHINSLYGDHSTGFKDLPKFNDNEPLTQARFQEIIENYKKINNFLNRNWNKYFDGSGYCILSCQVACQAACQLACQSCQYNTCHNQNCGGWS